jgi:transcriptional regulator with XRE-family HTH domain
MDPVQDVLAANIRRAREKKRMSVTALAQSTGHTVAFIEKVEKGRNSRLRVADLKRIAAALDVEPEVLLRRRTPRR